MNRSSWVILLLSAALLLPFLGNALLMDWDEVNFAECSREMLISGDLSQPRIAFQMFWEKPPFFIWLQALSMKVFGVNEYAARLPVALFGIATLLLIYKAGLRIKGNYFGLFWVLAYLGSLAPIFYFKLGLIDPVFNFFIYASVWQLYLAEDARRLGQSPRIHWLLCGIHIGLAMLCKGQVALLILGCVGIVRLIQRPRHILPGFSGLLLFLLGMCAILSTWIVPAVLVHGTEFLQQFLDYQLELVKGQIPWHNQPWYYHFVVLLLLCFPASILALPYMFKRDTHNADNGLFHRFMQILFWVVLVIFSIVRTKIIHYSSLCWLPLTYFAAFAAFNYHTKKGRLPGWAGIPALLIVFLLSAVLSLGALIGSKAINIKPYERYINDAFALDQLHANGHWLGIEYLLGIAFFFCACVWCIKQMGKRRPHPAWLFLICGSCSMLVYVFFLPRVLDHTQGSLVRELRALSGKNVYVESLEVKMYSKYYYAGLKPADMNGPWKTYHPEASLPDRRLFYFLDSPVAKKPVYIITRSNYKREEFERAFKVQKKLDGYLLWKKNPPEMPAY